jgi:hypothetical protein
LSSSKELDKLKRLLGWDTKANKITSRGKLLVKINDKTLAINADPYDSIHEIKHKVQQIKNINTEELLVFFANQEIEDNQTLLDYRIYKLLNTLFLSMVKKKMRISVRINNEREYEIEVSPEDRLDILPKILRKEALVSNELVFTYRNLQMDDNRTLFSFKIRDGNFLFPKETECQKKSYLYYFLKPQL